MVSGYKWMYGQTDFDLHIIHIVNRVCGCHYNKYNNFGDPTFKTPIFE